MLHDLLIYFNRNVPHFLIHSASKSLQTSVLTLSRYTTVVKLYPFSGWPQEQLKLNLEKLLDKAIIAVVTKNEATNKTKVASAELLAKYCELRNIQLEHSRTFVEIFVR